MTRYLVTGAAGFIGFHVCQRLLDKGWEVVGVDDFNDYYSVALKRARVAEIAERPGFSMQELDLAHRNDVARLFAEGQFERVVHLAAQIGVRYSTENPYAYVDSNLVAYLNILEGCRQHSVDQLVYASSSSVYGANRRMPFSPSDSVDHPVSLYAATKRANELMAHAYSHLYGLPTIGLRLFTVYGPWGRPDMAVYQFTRAIDRGEPIQVFNDGHMRRDFTYIDDVAEGILRAAQSQVLGDPGWNPESPKPDSSYAPYRIYNIGASQPEELMDLIRCISRSLGKEPVLEFCKLQPGDVLETYADVSDFEADLGFRPSVSLQTGVDRFVDWYRKYSAIIG